MAGVREEEIEYYLSIQSPVSGIVEDEDSVDLE